MRRAGSRRRTTRAASRSPSSSTSGARRLEHVKPPFAAPGRCSSTGARTTLPETTIVPWSTRGRATTTPHAACPGHLGRGRGRRPGAAHHDRSQARPDPPVAGSGREGVGTRWQAGGMSAPRSPTDIFTEPEPDATTPSRTSGRCGRSTVPDPSCRHEGHDRHPTRRVEGRTPTPRRGAAADRRADQRPAALLRPARPGYHQQVVRVSNGETFHDQVGYLLRGARALAGCSDPGDPARPGRDGGRRRRARRRSFTCARRDDRHAGDREESDDPLSTTPSARPRGDHVHGALRRRVGLRPDDVAARARTRGRLRPHRPPASSRAPLPGPEPLRPLTVRVSPASAAPDAFAEDVVDRRTLQGVRRTWRTTTATAAAAQPSNGTTSAVCARSSP